MAQYLASEVIKQAAERLSASRARDGMVHFLLLKRALVRAKAEDVAFSSNDENFTGAMRDLAASLPPGTEKHADLGISPFVKVFGTAGADKYVSARWTTNGPADALSGPKWSSVVQIQGTRPRRGSFKSGYQAHLADLLLKAGQQLPSLTDAAIWYHRATDLEAAFGHVDDTKKLMEHLSKSFDQQLGLKTEEITTLFDSAESPFIEHPVNSLLTDEIASPLEYLPDLTIRIGGFEDMVQGFAEDCAAVGLRAEMQLVRRFLASLGAKRFLILTGLSGSGKTKLAQAIAQWITPVSVIADPFKPGETLKGAQSEYTVANSDKSVVELINGDGTHVPLPKVIIEEWADYIAKHSIPETISGRDLRDKVEADSKITAHLHRLESHYKPAAFALVAARKARESIKCYEVVAVGADWVGSDSVLGYPNGLDAGSYVTKPALDLIIQAKEHPIIPHFLILDEMNLSHVERYFADILSAIESDEDIHLHTDSERRARGTKVPSSIGLPHNLFIVGTVNVDETTYMFSPKVLDRANVLEFRMAPEELKGFLDNAAKPDLAELAGRGYEAGHGESFVSAVNDAVEVPREVKKAFDDELLLFFQALQAHGAEFGYRTAYEASRFTHFYKLLGNPTEDDAAWFKDAFDCVIVQKLLPKLHGSRAKLGPVLKKLWFLCVTDPASRSDVPLKAAEDAARSTEKKSEPVFDIPAGAPYPLSAEKIARMWRLLMDNGFASFAEA
jgi:energy-coupling factor transporter ATP-binding protein EcfA2